MVSHGEIFGNWNIVWYLRLLEECGSNDMDSERSTWFILMDRDGEIGTGIYGYWSIMHGSVVRYREIVYVQYGTVCIYGYRTGKLFEYLWAIDGRKNGRKDGRIVRLISTPDL